jgi:hypothetical protein
MQKFKKILHGFGVFAGTIAVVSVSLPICTFTTMYVFSVLQKHFPIEIERREYETRAHNQN